jgi:8-oxo-dGTP diphosphatase
MGQANPLIRQRCAVVLIHEGKLLVLRQNNRPFWVLPGGTLEFGETLPACAARELEEETGLVIQINQLVGVCDFIDTASQRHVVDYLFTASYLSGPTEWQAPHPENINEIAWVSQSELAGLDLKPGPFAKALRHAWANQWHWPPAELGIYRPS